VYDSVEYDNNQHKKLSCHRETARDDPCRWKFC